MVSTDGTLPRDITCFFGLIWQLGALLAHFQHLFSINYICIMVVVQVIYHVVFGGKVLLIARLTFKSAIKVTSCDGEVSPFQ